MAKRNADADHMQRRSLRCHGTRSAKVTEEMTENVPGCGRSLAYSDAGWERHVMSHMPFREWCRHGVAGKGLERPHHRRSGHYEQFPLVRVDSVYPSGDATPMLGIDDQEWSLHSPLRDMGAADPHAVEQLALGSTQVTIRSGAEPAVMQVSAAVRKTRQAGSVTTLETCAPGDQQCDWRVAWSGHSRMNLSSTARCRYHHVAEPGHDWVRWARCRSNGGEVADTTWAGALSGNECGIEHGSFWQCRDG